MEPALVVEGAFCVLLVCGSVSVSIPPSSIHQHTFIILCETIDATDTQLSSRIGLIFGCVPHRWYVNKLDLVNRLWGTNSPAASRVKWPRPSTGRARFGQTITEKTEFHNSRMGEDTISHPGKNEGRMINEHV